MNAKRVLTATVVALLLGLTLASPAHARPLHDREGQVGPRLACAKLLVEDGQRGHCLVRHTKHFCVKKHQRHQTPCRPRRTASR